MAQQKKILIVDDMAIFRDPIAACLKLAGYATVCAGNGEQAMKVATAEQPDLILLDITMPGMDGLSALRAMRRHPLLGDTPVILLTAAAEKRYVVQAGQLGAKDYLLKSRFSLTELLARVKKHLGATPGEPASAGGPPAPTSPAPRAA